MLLQCEILLTIMSSHWHPNNKSLKVSDVWKNFSAFWRGISEKGTGEKKIFPNVEGGEKRGADQDFLKKLEGGTYIGGHCDSSCHLWSQKSVFIRILHHSSVSWETTLLYFFSWNFISFGQKEPIKMQNFKLLTSHAKFHQVCTLIGSFCWKNIKFQPKKYWRVMPHDTEEW